MTALKLAVSNIAWLASEEKAIATLLRSQGVEHVEIAPTRIGRDPRELTPREVSSYRSFWEDHGMRITAMQALLFGRPDLTIFGPAHKRHETASYLRTIIDIAAAVGATTLIFGSPRNRAVGSLDPLLVAEIEAEFFGQMGRIAAAAGTTFCIEPNPRQYGCDYLNTSVEVLELLERVGSPGLGLHLDAAGMTLAGEGPVQIDQLGADQLRHFHVSEPDLQPVGEESSVDHHGFAASLSRRNYERVVSIEMRPGPEGDNEARVTRAVDFAQRVYRTRAAAGQGLERADQG